MLGDSDADGEILGDSDAEGLIDADGDSDADGDIENEGDEDADALGEIEADGDTLGLTDGDSDADGDIPAYPSGNPHSKLSTVAPPLPFHPPTRIAGTPPSIAPSVKYPSYCTVPLYVAITYVLDPVPVTCMSNVSPPTGVSTATLAR